MPYRWTSISALGFLPALMRAVMASRSRPGHRFQVSASLSMKTGVAPTYRIGLAVATNVNEEHSTSSPTPTPSSTSPRCSAAVPDTSATPCAAPVAAQMSASNPVMFGPVGATQLSSIALCTKFSSCRPRWGGERYIRS